jgi:hypothetical protein
MTWYIGDYSYKNDHLTCSIEVVGDQTVHSVIDKNGSGLCEKPFNSIYGKVGGGIESSG